MHRRTLYYPLRTLKVDETKTNSPDEIPLIFYKRTIEIMKYPLAILFNQVSKSMHYPKQWKSSFIYPVFKSGDNAAIENYRPISVLPAISKIFDKLIFKYISERTTHLLAKQQHGFTKGKSTLSNLLEFTDFIKMNMMKGNQIDTVYMDLAKAFDRIDHTILLDKLKQFPIDQCMINLIHSYLTDRVQVVCVGGEKSDPIRPKSSVPQGTVLSPLLFALFINDLPALIKSNILLFADDLKIFMKIKNMNDARILQSDIQTIIDWCRRNILGLNVSKCYLLSFTRRHDVTFQYFNYNINGNTLTRVNTMKDLGILFDSKLTFECHVNSIVKRSFSTLGFISRSLNKFKKLHTYMLLYNTYVRSIIEYCTPIWSPHQNTHIKAIERVQRRFTRTIYRKFHYPSEKNFYMRYYRLDLLTLEDRRKLNDEITLYKIYSNRIITEVHAALNRNVPTRPIRFSNRFFYLPFVTTDVEFHSPMLRIQRRHDDLFSNNNIIEPSLSSFKLHSIKQQRLIFDYSFQQ